LIGAIVVSVVSIALSVVLRDESRQRSRRK
jgi:hypothetical protein